MQANHNNKDSNNAEHLFSIKEDWRERIWTAAIDVDIPNASLVLGLVTKLN